MVVSPLQIRQEDFWESEASLAYIASSRPPKAMEFLKTKDLWSRNE